MSIKTIRTRGLITMNTKNGILDLFIGGDTLQNSEEIIRYPILNNVSKLSNARIGIGSFGAKHSLEVPDGLKLRFLLSLSLGTIRLNKGHNPIPIPAFF